VAPVLRGRRFFVIGWGWPGRRPGLFFIVGAAGVGRAEIGRADKGAAGCPDVRISLGFRSDPVRIPLGSRPDSARAGSVASRKVGCRGGVWGWGVWGGQRPGVVGFVGVKCECVDWNASWGNCGPLFFS